MASTRTRYAGRSVASQELFRGGRSMRKVMVLGVVVLATAVAAVAYAQTTNTYDVDGSTSPTRAGTSKKPVPVSVRFSYTVGSQSGARPTPVKKYSIRFSGLVVNTRAFPKCSARRLEDRGPAG